MRVTINNGRLIPVGSSRSGFSLIELLVVLVIMGMLAVFTLPAMKNMRQSNALVSAGRQLVDDLARARNRAIADQTTVYVVFVPPEIYQVDFSALPAQDRKLADRLKAGGFTTYNIYAERTVGDQPGTRKPRFIGEWRSLPDGVLMETNAFYSNLAAKTFPFPGAFNTPERLLYYVAFDNRGKLLVPATANPSTLVPFSGALTVPLARGSILYSRANDGTLLEAPDVRQITPDDLGRHWVVIDGVTGRARVETQALY